MNEEAFILRLMAVIQFGEAIEASGLLIDNQLYCMDAGVIRLREAVPPPNPRKYRDLQREDWRGQGKRRARFPK